MHIQERKPKENVNINWNEVYIYGHYSLYTCMVSGISILPKQSTGYNK